MSILRILHRGGKPPILIVGDKEHDMPPEKRAPRETPQLPTLLQKERELLSEAQAELHKIQLAVIAQQNVIAEHRKTIQQLEDNPWVEELYKLLRSRETTLTN